MIKIQNRKLDEICDWHYNEYLKSEGYKKLTEIISDSNTIEEKLWKFISGSLKIIITGKPRELEEVANYLKTEFASIKDNENIIKQFKAVFDYKKFTENEAKGWNAYSLAEKLNVPTCPYCNIQFTHTVIDYTESEKGKKRITRPDFDHFLSKSVHPYLGLSFYNLIPSCTTCNSKSKVAKIFSIDTHIHPYCFGFDKLFKFQLRINDTSFFYGNLEGCKIELNEKTNPTKQEEKIITNAKRNIEDFRLEKLYQEHLDYSYEIISKAYIYNEDYLNNLYKQFSGSLFKDRSDFIRLLTTNYVDEDELHLRPLAKLTKDLCEQFELW